MATFVLVPGAWHSGWWFDPLARRFRRHGHEAYLLTLTGVGDRNHLLTDSVNLDNIQDLANVLEAERIEDAVLVGHSYGGMVITGVADRVPERVATRWSTSTPSCPTTEMPPGTWPLMTYADGTLREHAQTATPSPCYPSSTPRPRRTRSGIPSENTDFPAIPPPVNLKRAYWDGSLQTAQKPHVGVKLSGLLSGPYRHTCDTG